VLFSTKLHGKLTTVVVTTLSRLHHQHVVRYYHAWIDNAEESDIMSAGDIDDKLTDREEEGEEDDDLGGEEEDEEDDQDYDASDWFAHSISKSRNPGAGNFSEDYSSDDEDNYVRSIS